MIGWDGGYVMSFWIENPFEMVISPSLQPINALDVANQGFPK